MISRWFMLTPLIIACNPEVVALQGSFLGKTSLDVLDLALLLVW